MPKMHVLANRVSSCYPISHLERAARRLRHPAAEEGFHVMMMDACTAERHTSPADRPGELATRLGATRGNPDLMAPNPTPLSRGLLMHMQMQGASEGRGAASAETQTDRLAKWANCMRHGWTDKEAQELGRRRHRSNETITISRGANPFGIEERRGEDRLPNGLLSADY